MKLRSDSGTASTFALAAFALTLVHGPRARAESSGLALEWQAPAGCPSRDAVLNRLWKMVGKSTDRVSRLRATGRIEGAHGRYRLTLKVREGDAETERVIESDSCSDLAGAAAVALGLLVRDEIREDGAPDNDGQGVDGSPPSKGEATVSASPPDTETDAANQPSASETSNPTHRPAAALPAAAPPPANDSRSVRFLLRAPQLGIDVGPLPRPSPTFGLSAGLGVGGLELTVGARLGLTQTVWADGVPAYGAEVRRAAIELRACYALPVGQFSIAPCFLSALEPLSARGVGDEVASQTQSVAVFAVGAAALARFQLGELLALVVSVGGQVETSRPQLLVDGLGEVATLAPFALTTSTGLEWIL